MQLGSGHTLLDRFTLERLLGGGASSEVWLAQDRERSATVAIKVLRSEFVNDPAAVAVIEREYAHASALAHPNVVQVRELRRVPGLVLLVMEYVAGGDLRAYRGRPCADWLPLLCAVCDALEAVHGHGLVHRDLKLSNVLIDPRGPKLSDFGQSLPIGSAPANNAGRGSPFSMSPQQRAGAPAQTADDIYAFGVMCHELLTGYPPGYAAEARSLQNSQPLHSTTLLRLIDDCLHHSEQERPNLKTLRARLQAAINEVSSTPSSIPHTSAMSAAQPPRVTPPSSEPLRGHWQRSTQPASNEAQLRNQGFRRGLLASVFVVLLAGLLFVFVVLPRWVEPPPPVATKPATANQTVAAAPAAPAESVDFAKQAELKQLAEEKRAQLEERMSALRERAVEQWGGEPLKRYNAEFAAGEEKMQTRAYAEANKHYEDATPLLGEVEQLAAVELRKQLEQGRVALAEGRSQDAQAAFQLVLKIEPKNATATAGLKRAQSLDQVLKLYAQGQQQEKAGALTAAAEFYRQALALDREFVAANEALGRVQAQLTSNAFAATMARGFAALARNDYSIARQEFEAADKLRPQAPEVAQALKQVEQESRTQTIAQRLERARAAEQKEQWSAALTEYREILKLDNTVAFAVEGVARTEPRAKLHDELELYVTQPERLFSTPVRASARDALAEARATNPAGPELKRQITTLEQWLARAEAPVQVAFESDNQTQVTVYRVGSLGTFARRELELAPGKYTVVGTRPGYRDVRREITVIPGAAGAPVVIRCEDKI